MALVLNMMCGEDLYVGSAKFSLHKSSVGNFCLCAEDGQCFDLDDQRSKEILPNVFVSIAPEVHETRVRVVVDAPRQIGITRGSKYVKKESDSV